MWMFFRRFGAREADEQTRSDTMADAARNSSDRNFKFSSREIASRGLMLVACAALAVATGGCSRGVKLLTVNGRVSVNHQPLEKGIIHFQPADGLGPGAEAVVVAGNYQIATTVGHKKVSVLGFKKVGKVSIGGPGGPETDKLEQIVPAKFSDPNQTELVCEVSGSDHPLDFDLPALPAQNK
jgi:hypothetical protein